MTGIYPQPKRDPSLSWLLGIAIAWGFVAGLIVAGLAVSLRGAL